MADSVLLLCRSLKTVKKTPSSRYSLPYFNSNEHCARNPSACPRGGGWSGPPETSFERRQFSRSYSRVES